MAVVSVFAFLRAVLWFLLLSVRELSREFPFASVGVQVQGHVNCSVEETLTEVPEEVYCFKNKCATDKYL